MKKSKYPIFSNGTEFEMWEHYNCDKCVKASRYNPKKDEYTKFRCKVQEEIIMAYLDDGRASQRTYDICQNSVCKYLQAERKKYSKKSKFVEHPSLFEL